MACVPALSALGGTLTVANTLARPTGTELYPRMIFQSDTRQVLFYDGTGWLVIDEPWTSYTPTFANVTVSDGTRVFQYKRSGDTCDVAGRFTLGSTSAITGVAQISLPFAGSSPGYFIDSATVKLYDSSANSHVVGVATADSTSSIVIGAALASGTYVTNAGLSSTVPFTWAIGDFFNVSFRYRMASFYA